MVALSESNLQTLGHLEAAVQRARDFTLLVVEAPHAGLGAQVQARLASLDGISLEEISLDAAGLLGTLLTSGTPAPGTRPVLLVREVEPLPAELASTLSRLNERRNALIHTRPGAFVFCASAEGLELLASAATDLWSIRSDLFRLEVQALAAPSVEAILRGLMTLRPEPSMHSGEELEVLAAETEATGNILEAIRLWLRAGDAHSASTKAPNQSTHQAEIAYTRAARLATQEGQPEQLGAALLYLGMLFFRQRQMEEATDFLQHSRVTFQRAGAHDLEAMPQLFLGIIHAEKDGGEEAAKAMQRFIQILQRQGNTALSVTMMLLFSGAISSFGKDTEGENMFQAALQLLRDDQDPFSATEVLRALGEILRVSGDLKLAETAFTQALAPELKGQDRIDILISLGEIYLETERLAKAEKSLRNAEALANSQSDPDAQLRAKSLLERLEQQRSASPLSTPHASDGSG